MLNTVAYRQLRHGCVDLNLLIHSLNSSRLLPHTRAHLCGLRRLPLTLKQDEILALVQCSKV